MYFLRKLAVPGSLLLPRKVAGAINWPRCARCGRIVDAYGLENDTPKLVTVWARCDGTLQDPATGRIVPGAARVHPMMKGSITIQKGPGWTQQRFTDSIARMAFFEPEGGTREWVQTLTEDGVDKRWSAG